MKRTVEICIARDRHMPADDVINWPGIVLLCANSSPHLLTCSRKNSSMYWK